MGTTLTGTTPQDTYDSLIKVGDNGPIDGTLKRLSLMAWATICLCLYQARL
jgi:hypothetical protein